MFFPMPLLPILAIYIAAAVVPAFILLRYVYRHDTIEKEPPLLLVTLFLLGVVSALCATVLESIAQTVLELLIASESPFYTVLVAFLVVAVMEEGAKLYFLKRRTWDHPAFNYRFDGIVYAVFVSLGFAAYENILYVFQYGLSVALPRALLAIPGHMSFAVFMGFFYGRAKRCEGRGKEAASRRNLRRGYFTAVFLHGFYDACAMTGGGKALLVFAIFIVLMYLSVYRTLRRESVADAPV
ncbi:MAG: PrsW family intramembrane metalloprotease [Oscillibacter sp.]|nr:PrsW family intramembrane metalloprotease [Oscillibacter sp.]